MNRYVEAIARARFTTVHGYDWQDTSQTTRAQYMDDAQSALTALIDTLRNDPGAVQALLEAWDPALRMGQIAEEQRNALADYLEQGS